MNTIKLNVSDTVYPELLNPLLSAVVLNEPLGTVIKELEVIENTLFATLIKNGEVAEVRLPLEDDIRDGVCEYIKIANIAQKIERHEILLLVINTLNRIAMGILYGEIKYSPVLDIKAQLESIEDDTEYDAFTVTALDTERRSHFNDGTIAASECFAKPLSIVIGDNDCDPINYSVVYPVVLTSKTITFFTTIAYPHMINYRSSELDTWRTTLGLVNLFPVNGNNVYTFGENKYSKEPEHVVVEYTEGKFCLYDAYGRDNFTMVRPITHSDGTRELSFVYNGKEFRKEI